MSAQARTYKIMPSIKGRYRAYFRAYYALIFTNAVLALPLALAAEHAGLPHFIPQLFSFCATLMAAACCFAIIGPHIPGLRANHDSKRYKQALDCIGWGIPCAIIALANVGVLLYVMIA